LLAGQQMVGSDMIGEKWYEFKIGKDENGKDLYVDIRPYTQFSQYIMLNKIVKDYIDGLPVTTEYIKEIFEGLTGMRNVPGTSFGVPLLDALAQGLDSVDSTEGMSKFLSKTLASVIKPYIRPLKEAGDFLNKNNCNEQRFQQVSF
jgi:hypothetical protein